MKTIIAAFSDRMAADTAASQLRSSGTRAQDIRVIDQGADSDLPGTLRRLEVPKDRGELYAEVVRRGATLVIAHAEDQDANQVAAELDRRGSLDLEAAAGRWRSAGWTGYETSAQPLDREAIERERAELDRDSVAVVQEDVQVGKRAVEKGVRIRTFVTERPVHETVQLREEHVRVEREPVDEPVPVSATDSTFTDDEFTVTATSEEAVVGKQARVVERVRVDKEADTRTETIEETERRRDVEVEPIEPTTPRR